MKWLWLSVAVILLDQATKHVASGALELHQPVAVLPFLNFTLTRNPGAAFSFLSDAGGWQRWFFIALSIVVSVIIVAWLRSLPPQQRWVPSALALILGGALGNVWDRVILGEVVDFVDLHYAGWHWPAFNVADSAICIGAAMLIVHAFQGREET